MSDVPRPGIRLASPGRADSPFTHLVTSISELRGDGYPEPPARAWEKEIDTLDEHCTDFLRRSPLSKLATSDADGRTTVTPRGGPPGFVRVLDAKRIAWADLTGNRRIDGTAYLTRDPAVLRAVDGPGRTASLALGVAVRTAFLHCGKAMVRSRVWQPESWPAAEALPSAAAMLLAARGERVPVEHAAARLEEGYITHLW
ncbi:MAG: pyridoxamine 5'-phosphate oxidase family protein [Actinomycetota bacterium]|nr:pyridoxamine 5'-phosphate oxidase family protein [Actinomycetota bacterium]